MAVLGVAAGACARPPLGGVCDLAAPGEVVVSELRGPQNAADRLGQWVEVYNAGGDAVDLRGMRLEWSALDGGAGRVVFVRRSFSLAAGAYAVMGPNWRGGAAPSWLDVDVAGDWSDDMAAAGVLTLSACGTVYDQIVYRSLPESGSLAFDGRQVPDAVANDDEGAWCGDAATADGAGTPGARNRECPE